MSRSARAGRRLGDRMIEERGRMDTRMTHLLHDARPIRAAALLTAALCIVSTALLAAPARAQAAVFNPLNIISYETWRASSAMSVADIQAFLDAQTGPLKTLVAKNHDIVGVATPDKKPASQLIYEAARYWNINPKVILATLQKEQSLLTTSNSSDSARFRKAMGCGVYGDADHDGKTDNRYPGFGNQIWNGARVFSTYENTYAWAPGKTKTVTDLTTRADKKIVPLNACTFALYTYTPYYPQKGFWNIYTQYFEDPLAPPRLKPVYRFRNKANGTYYYTASEAKRYTLIRTAAKKWTFQGVSFSVDTSAAANSVPLYQMYNTVKHKYYYTTSTAKRAALLKVRPRQWRADAAVCYVTRETSGTAPVYRIQSKSTGGYVLTSSSSTMKRLSDGRSAPFAYRGIFFRLDSLDTTTTPVGPSS
jgi:hypothetical protein